MSTTVDLQDELDRLEEQMEEIRSKAADLAENERESDEGATLEAEYESAQRRYNALSKELNEWGHGQFTIRELSFGELMLARDEVSQESFSRREDGSVEGIPRDGYYRVKVLELAVEETPPGCEDDPRHLDYYVGDWLYGEVDRLNTSGGANLGNLWDEVEGS